MTYTDVRVKAIIVELWSRIITGYDFELLVSLEDATIQLQRKAKELGVSSIGIKRKSEETKNFLNNLVDGDVNANIDFFVYLAYMINSIIISYFENEYQE